VSEHGTENLVGDGAKLVRDRIPEIIRSSGFHPNFYAADPEEYRIRLRDKLSEEVAEFLSASRGEAAEELADVLEVVQALAADLGVGPEELEAIRARKARERGVFNDRVVWTGNKW